MEFILKVIQPTAAAMFVFTLICLVGYGYPAIRNRGEGGDVVWLLWLLGGIMTFVAWVRLVFF